MTLTKIFPMLNQAITALLEILRIKIGLSKRRVKTLYLIIIAIVRARSMNIGHFTGEQSGTA